MLRLAPLAVLALLLAAPAFAAPKLDGMAPIGGRQGGEVQVRVTGTDLGDVTGMWFADPRLQARMEAGGKPNEQHLSVTIPSDMPAGLYECRLTAKSGISEARLFCVGTLPELPESKETTTQASPQEVQAPVTVVGQINSNTKAEWFRLLLKKGEWATVVCVARAAGSRLDPFLRALDPAVRTLVRDDDAGQNRDARLQFQAPVDGEYTVELRDLGYRGGEGFPFRLSFHTGSYVTAVVPAAVQSGAEATVQARVSGRMVPVRVTPPADAEWDGPGAEARAPGAPDPFPLPVSPYPQVMEGDAHGTAATAQPLSLPCGVTGSFGKIGEGDFYRVALKQGERLQIRARMVNWNGIGSPSIVVFGTDGKQVKFERGTGYDTAETTVQATAAGDYVVCLHDLLWKYRGGPEFGYYAEFSHEDPPNFRLRYRNGITAYTVAPGGEVKIPMTLERRSFTGPVALDVRGLPDGCTYEPKTVTATGDFDLVVKCGAAPPAAFAVAQVWGKASLGGSERLRLARCAVRVAVIDQDNVDTDPEVTHLGLTFGGTKMAGVPGAVSRSLPEDSGPMRTVLGRSGLIPGVRQTFAQTDSCLSSIRAVDERYRVIVGAADAGPSPCPVAVMP